MPAETPRSIALILALTLISGTSGAHPNWVKISLRAAGVGDVLGQRRVGGDQFQSERVPRHKASPTARQSQGSYTSSGMPYPFRPAANDRCLDGAKRAVGSARRCVQIHAAPCNLPGLAAPAFCSRWRKGRSFCSSPTRRGILLPERHILRKSRTSKWWSL